MSRPTNPASTSTTLLLAALVTSTAFVPDAQSGECPPEDTFTTVETLLLDGSAKGLDVADLDGDGDPDVVSSSSGGGYSVLINNGEADPTLMTVAAEGPTRSVELADLDGDGLVDLAMSLGEFSVGGVVVRLGLGDGTFGAPAEYPLGASTTDVEAADLNGDGILDLVATGRSAFPPPGTSALGVFIGVGDGSFLPAVTYPTGTAPIFLTAADLNLDGWIDVVLPDHFDDEISVYMNQGDGTLAPAVNIAVSDTPLGVVSDDFNGDGLPDLLASALDEASPVLLGRGDGTFDVGPPLIVPFGAGAITVLDLNGDEHVDVACHRSLPAYNTVIWTFVGQGDGTFEISGSYHGDGGVIAAADWTGDDVDDVLIMSNQFRVAPGVGNGTLDTLHATPTGGLTAILVDLNGDGIDDLVGSDFATSVSVALGLGDGTFAPPVATTVPHRASFLAHGDVDGDGDVDIVVTDFRVEANATVLLGNGDGTLSLGTTYSTFSVPAEVVLADVDEDGALDLLISHSSTASVQLRLGNGDGTFGGSMPVAGGRREILVADLDGDGLMDIAQPDDGGFIRRLGNGDGSFQPIETFDLPLADLFPYGGDLTAADVNDDGVLDILAFGPDVVDSTHEVVVRLGTGTGGYAPAQTFATGQAGTVIWRTLAVSDFNGDNVHDVAVTGEVAGSRAQVAVLHGLGGGSFGSPTIFEHGRFGARDLAAGDLDANGATDLVLATGNDGSGVIMLNHCAGTLSCQGDVNGDGNINVDDLVNVILAWGSDDAEADVDGDGFVGVDDLVAVIVAWGPCV